MAVRLVAPACAAAHHGRAWMTYLALCTMAPGTVSSATNSSAEPGCALCGTGVPGAPSAQGAEARPGLAPGGT